MIFRKEKLKAQYKSLPPEQRTAGSRSKLVLAQVNFSFVCEQELTLSVINHYH